MGATVFPAPPQLPVYTTTLIGRDAQAALIAAQLQAPATRALTLVGASGTGKTRLSLQIAEMLRDSFPTGAYFVALAPVHDARLVLVEIAQALGLQEDGGTPLLDTLATTIGDHAVLLILDNFEQVQAAHSDLTALLARTANLKLLITSQVPLGMAGETACAVPALDIPAAALPAAALLEYSAIALFVDRIRAVQPEFSLTAENIPAVIEICRRVKGLPLAIELIAAHSDVLLPQDLLILLRNHLAIGSATTPPQRDQVLWPVLDWCYSKLAPAEQALFVQLGVFAGGWTHESAQQICAAQAGPEIDISAGLRVLVGGHLVQEESLPGQGLRYIMLDAIHEYTLLRLQQLRERDALLQRHSAHYVELAAAAEEGLKGAAQGEWLTRLRSEHHNIRQALEWLLAHGSPDAMLLSSRIWQFWYMAGYLSEGRRWLEQALTTSPDHSAFLHGKTLNALGILAWAQGDYPAAEALYLQTLAVHRGNSDQLRCAQTLNNLGIVTFSQGKYAAAASHYRAALAIFRDLDNLKGVAAVLDNLGLVLGEQGELAQAHAVQTESLAIRRQLGNPGDIATSLNNLGELAMELEDLAEARTLIDESLLLHQQINDRVGLAYALHNHARLLWSERQRRAAFRALIEALEIRAEVADLRGVAISLARGGYLLLECGSAAAAAQLLACAGALRAQIGAALVPTARAEYDAALERLRALLGADFAAAWAAGQQLPIPVAITMVREHTPDVDLNI